MRAAGTPFLTGQDGGSPARRPLPGGLDPNSRKAPEWLSQVSALKFKDTEMAFVSVEQLAEHEWDPPDCSDSESDPEPGSDDSEDDHPGRLVAGPDGSTSCSPAAPAQSKEEEEAELDKPGVLAPAAASIVMKVMYGARMVRVDLLRRIQGLARYMTKWTRRQDRDLHRMMCYIQATKHWKAVGWVGDSMKDVGPLVCSDSDHAGCDQTMRSTSGGFACMRGPDTSFPISAASKRQGCSSTSTTEAELVAAQRVISKMGDHALGCH